jgi:hypothetical protein
MKFLAASGLISLKIKTEIVGGKTTVLGTPNISHVPTKYVVSETGIIQIVGDTFGSD